MNSASAYATAAGIFDVHGERRKRKFEEDEEEEEKKILEEEEETEIGRQQGLRGGVRTVGLAGVASEA